MLILVLSASQLLTIFEVRMKDNNTNRQMNGWRLAGQITHRHMDKQTDRRTAKLNHCWTDGRTDEQMDGKPDGQCLPPKIITFPVNLCALLLKLSLHRRTLHRVLISLIMDSPYVVTWSGDFQSESKFNQIDPKNI